VSAAGQERGPADRVLSPAEVGSRARGRLAEEETGAAPDEGVAAGSIPRDEDEVPAGLAGRVKKFIRYFQTAGRRKFERWLARSGRYAGLMREILAKYGLPEDLVYLALIESGFSPNAYSTARAVGPWQFIAGTAKRYGLRVDWWADERRDFEKSTHAAASYLKDLYGLFESWDLAAAAYNAGEGKIMRAVMKYNTEAYTDLIRGRYLAQETKDYVPKMYAALSIAKNPQKYGFGDVRLEEPLDFDRVEVPGGTDLAVLGSIVGLSVEAIREWNPELRRFCTPPDQASYELRLPRGYGEVARQRMGEIAAAAKVTFLAHPVRRGETLEGLSKRYNVSVAVLREMNGLRGNGIGRVRELVIPVTGLSPEEAPPGREIAAERLDALLARAGEGARKARERTRIVVRRGDTLARVAARAGVSVGALASANGLSPRARLRAGAVLRLPGTPEPRADRPAAGAREEAPARHVVRSGDTLWKIARTYGVSVERLAERNGLARSGSLRVGRVLVIPPES